MALIAALSSGSIRQRLQSYDSYETEDRSQQHVANHIEHNTRHIPFIASPLDPKTTEWLKNKHQASNLTLKRRPTIAQQEATRISGGIFRKQKEASPLELFFDLFFVANLAVFSYNHSQATADSVANYVGFFCLMWTFWFHVSIHDVRFYVDTILNRFLKLVQFAIWVGFTGLSPVYNTLHEGGTSRAFHGLALVFMVSRLVFIIQYAVVFWYVRPFKKTRVPLCMMMLVYLCSGMAFLGTFIDDKGLALNEVRGFQHVIVWYIIITIEAVAVIIVSSIWRILSFKWTHLVERVGLLTLIIIGEGTIGIIKSISIIVDGTQIDIWNAAGRVISGVFLIYLIFVLYFTPIEHDRFGTIRQQFWVLLHCPLHVAILLTTEGSAETLLWTTVLKARTKLIDLFPSTTKPSDGFTTINDLLNSLNTTMKDTAASHTYKKLKDVYDWNADLSRIQNISTRFPYGSSKFNEGSAVVINDMLSKTSNFFFENFKFEGTTSTKSITDPSKKLSAYYDAYTVVFTTFYVCAGCLLLVLGFMYSIGKNKKTWPDYIGIFLRIIIGLILPFISITAYIQPRETGYMFDEAGWIVPVVVFSYLGIVMVDNIVQNAYDKRLDKKIAKGKADISEKRHQSTAFGPQASHESTIVDFGHVAKGGHHRSDTSNTKSSEFEYHTHSRYDSQSNANSHPNSGYEESDGLISGEATLSGRRDSEQVQMLPPLSHQRIERSRERLDRSAFILPPMDAAGSEKDENSYHGVDSYDTDLERGRAHQRT